ncbi:MAG: glycoside hydrolase family 5 protein [Caldilineaceae bacterium]
MTAPPIAGTKSCYRRYSNNQIGAIVRCHRLFTLFLLLILLAACNTYWPSHPTPSPSTAPIFVLNRKLGHGLNLGDALDAPSEGEWGLALEEEYFKLIADAGFDHIRVPIRWTAHAADTPPYTIDETFFERIDWVLENAKANGLAVVINHHHYDQVMSDPVGQHDKFVSMWQQIATRYRDQPDSVIFELLNEASGELTMNKWNDLAAELIAVIRKNNPTRAIIIGSIDYNKLHTLPLLKLPDDPNLIVTFHYYEPFSFTTQGADWLEGADSWLGTTWTGTVMQRRSIERDFDQVATWARANNRPIYLGEFGAIRKADDESRIRWTRAVTESASKRDFSLAYWEFASEFGLYDRERNEWNQGLLDAALGK